MSPQTPCCSVDRTCPLRSGRGALLASERALWPITVGQSARVSDICLKRNRKQNMTATLICNSDGIFTGLPGDAMRATGAIRVLDGRIAAIGDLAPEPGEEIIDASGCVILSGSRVDAPPSVSEHPQGCARRHESAADGLAAFGPAFLLA